MMEINGRFKTSTKAYIYDVAVIGGGPAGLLCCFWLQKFGISHLLIEKEEYPRDKSCADILTSNAIRRINEVDPLFIPELIELGLLRPIYGTDLSTPNKHTLNLAFKNLDNLPNTPSCYSIQRAQLDHFLYKKLISNPLTQSVTGCSVRTIDIKDDCCEITGSKGELYFTKLSLVATGSNFNPLAKKKTSEAVHSAVGIRAYYRGIEAKSNDCELFLMQDFMPGGFYIAPLEDGLFNVNMVIRGDIVKTKDVNLKREFENFIQQNEVLSHRFQNAERISEFAGSSLLLGTKARQICGNRYMFLGDSAGLIDLISANGIPQAMLSGKMAAHQAQQCFEKNDFSKNMMLQYQRSLFKMIKNDIAVGKTLNPFLKYSFVHKSILGILNFLTKSSSRNSTLIKLFYSKKPSHLLFNPTFYFSLLKESALTRRNDN